MGYMGNGRNREMGESCRWNAVAEHEIKCAEQETQEDLGRELIDNHMSPVQERESSRMTHRLLTWKTWTNINPFTEAASAPGGVESVGGICGALIEKSRRQLQYTGLEPRRVVALNCCFISHFNVFGIVFVFNVFGNRTTHPSLFHALCHHPYWYWPGSRSPAAFWIRPLWLASQIRCSYQQPYILCM